MTRKAYGSIVSLVVAIFLLYYLIAVGNKSHMMAFTGEVYRTHRLIKVVGEKTVIKWVLLMRTEDGQDVWLYVSRDICEKYGEKLDAKEKVYTTFLVRPERYSNHYVKLADL